MCLTHNDFFNLNILIDRSDRMHLIDWEYAGMSDYAHDFGTFTVCCKLSESEADAALAAYFGRIPTFAERCHNFAFVALAGWCWSEGAQVSGRKSISAMQFAILTA